jgi:hypothetical protein
MHNNHAAPQFHFTCWRASTAMAASACWSVRRATRWGVAASPSHVGSPGHMHQLPPGFCFNLIKLSLMNDNQTPASEANSWISTWRFTSTYAQPPSCITCNMRQACARSALATRHRCHLLEALHQGACCSCRSSRLAHTQAGELLASCTARMCAI